MEKCIPHKNDQGHLAMIAYEMNGCSDIAH